MVSLSKEYNQLVNLTKFNVNFSRFISNNEILHQSPDYILNKYNHWIGFEPTVEHKSYTPDDMTDFFNKYWKIWRPSVNDINSKLKNILMYLYSTQNMNLITMVGKFEEYIGHINKVSELPNKKGLHFKLDEFVGTVLKENEDNIKIILRDMKINSLIKK